MPQGLRSGRATTLHTATGQGEVKVEARRPGLDAALPLASSGWFHGAGVSSVRLPSRTSARAVLGDRRRPGRRRRV